MFSKPEVVARIREHFIPVALKAATVDNPPAGIEGAIHRELRRTRAAPQGICVMNSAGKAIAWSLGFDDEANVGGFFDHAKGLYEKHPQGGTPTERYHRFPSRRMEDVADSGKALEIPDGHGDADPCPGNLALGKGSLAGRIVGRAYDKDGKPQSEVRTQDNYIEDILEITRAMQDQLIASASQADGRFRLPPALGREIVSNAYLGMLDVNPLGGDNVRAKLLEESITFWAEPHADGDGQLLVTGTSNVAAKNRDDIPSDRGRLWSHRVQLTWRGFITLDENGITEIALLADGDEQLKWGGPGSAVSPQAADNPVAHLLSGRPLDISTKVRYGATAKRQR